MVHIKKDQLKPIGVYMGAVVLTALLLTLIPSYSFAGETNEQVDKLLEPWTKPGSPGCALAVVKDGKIIYKNGYGEANLEHGAAITPETVFYIGSVSKQFVAFSIALLEAQGKLSFDDSIRKYVPELPGYCDAVTIRHLIHHTGGIRGYLSLLWLAGLDEDFYHSGEDVIKNLLVRQKSLNFKPGEKYQYSNSGYLLLGEIVHRVSGMSFREFAQKNILDPLGMKNSHFHDDFSEIIKNRAMSYFQHPKRKNEYTAFISKFDLVGSGGLYTTVEDLFLWDQNFYHGKVGGKQVIETVLTRGKLNDNSEQVYAFGLVHGQYKGLKTVSHGGALGGYRAMLLRFPEQRFSVICLSNFGGFNVAKIGYQVADIYLQDQLKTPGSPKTEKKKTRFAKLSRKHLEDKTGAYLNPGSRRILKISVSDEENRLTLQLASRKYLLAPVSKTRFKILELNEDIFVVFSRENKKSPFTMQLFAGDRLEDTCKPVQLVSPSPEELEQYTGEFFSPELNVTYTFVIKEGKLWLEFRNAPDSPFNPTIKDEFILEGMVIRFSRDSEGKINGFTVVEGLTRIPFGKV
ncbi:MAG: serine hydrolase [Candidatus Aminicenantes bacterium]|nr:serine hydrolase [Candidatus Aminicenantes bacterium]NIM83652.1 serine hydrolase [Candidatus Aminicenantes bacterium]NIN23076.1 serine hydrolase [Candidatus Aminicenantes bacterium]NIN46803.1 serine hydrolase [Candidatus Aminicenantes bacterium]NIN89725.1 serine hydrolase [Candidatus Aminicenantes bacterium]